jgi:predicted nuclease with TOPRIM domain
MSDSEGKLRLLNEIHDVQQEVRQFNQRIADLNTQVAMLEQRRDKRLIQIDCARQQLKTLEKKQP